MVFQRISRGLLALGLLLPGIGSADDMVWAKKERVAVPFLSLPVSQKLVENEVTSESGSVATIDTVDRLMHNERTGELGLVADSRWDGDTWVVYEGSLLGGSVRQLLSLNRDRYVHLNRIDSLPYIVTPELQEHMALSVLIKVVDGFQHRLLNSENSPAYLPYAQLVTDEAVLNIIPGVHKTKTLIASIHSQIQPRGDELDIEIPFEQNLSRLPIVVAKIKLLLKGWSTLSAKFHAQGQQQLNHYVDQRLAEEVRALSHYLTIGTASIAQAHHLKSADKEATGGRLFREILWEQLVNHLKVDEIKKLDAAAKGIYSELADPETMTLKPFSYHLKRRLNVLKNVAIPALISTSIPITVASFTDLAVVDGTIPLMLALSAGGGFLSSWRHASADYRIAKRTANALEWIHSYSDVRCMILLK